MYEPIHAVADCLIQNDNEEKGPEYLTPPDEAHALGPHAFWSAARYNSLTLMAPGQSLPAPIFQDLARREHCEYLPGSRECTRHGERRRLSRGNLKARYPNRPSRLRNLCLAADAEASYAMVAAVLRRHCCDVRNDIGDVYDERDAPGLKETRPSLEWKGGNGI
ncbi:hypothetical protein LX32DRAFT_77357 [Colletotrichum zoysiae]|uniref:Uncharacterized protein n=1 Tax=Colletotrichum zoysiae TaxID=1216348 RepID=A0AAD9LWL8_9PEZI|nr:hypothetical protein LX32DRAFT_77357 [Colletotrichum zoysiae]